jgi:hypothetical protein
LNICGDTFGDVRSMTIKHEKKQAVCDGAQNVKQVSQLQNSLGCSGILDSL